VPGADDPVIQTDILATLGRDTALVRQALDHLARLAGQPLAELDAAKRDAVAQEFRSSGGAAGRKRSSASCCNVTTATTACCVRSGLSCARRSQGLRAPGRRLVAARPVKARVGALRRAP